MKIFLSFFLGIGLPVASIAFSPAVLELIPKNIDINLRRHLHARKELMQLIENCGEGVVVLGKENRCSFQVALDELFFRPKKMKTGLLPDEQWAYRDGVTWYSPAISRAAVPDTFDLRDMMKRGLPEIKTQQCGDCWAWATHHAVEINRAVHDQLATDHSVQTVLSCSQAGSCGGGYMSAPNFIVKRGLPYEKDFPYKNGVTGTCKFSSSEMNAGKWDGKIIAAPYVGNSMRYSRAKRSAGGVYADGTSVSEMIAAMAQWNAPLVVTVAAYDIKGPGVYNSCSAINSGGDHMVTIVGWEMLNGKRIAHVWNSWGMSHGENGVSRIQWECGAGKLNRGLGVSARVVQYAAPCVAPDAAQKGLVQVVVGQKVQIGASQPPNTKCEWYPSTDLSDPTSCTPMASPSVTTEYHLQTSNACGNSSSMVLVQTWDSIRKKTQTIRTPFGTLKNQPILTQSDVEPLE